VFELVEREKIVQVAARTLRSERGKRALDYLKEERGLSESVIERFQIGYCPPDVEHELSGRIITPIFDPYGKVVALSTRHLDRKKDFWHESFDKHFYLYGLHLAKSSIIKNRRAILVEGEFDVAYLHSRGADMTVGCCGSAFSVFQASTLGRYCSEIYLVFDSDVSKKPGMLGSGQRAIQRAMEMQKEILMDMKFIPVHLPLGEDPDDFVKANGIKAFSELLRESKENAELFEG